jgi:uncharacterized membrane protein
MCTWRASRANDIRSTRDGIKQATRDREHVVGSTILLLLLLAAAAAAAAVCLSVVTVLLWLLLLLWLWLLVVVALGIVVVGGFATTCALKQSAKRSFTAAKSGPVNA